MNCIFILKTERERGVICMNWCEWLLIWPEIDTLHLDFFFWNRDSCWTWGLTDLNKLAGQYALEFILSLLPQSGFTAMPTSSPPSFLQGFFPPILYFFLTYSSLIYYIPTTVSPALSFPQIHLRKEQTSQGHQPNTRDPNLGSYACTVHITHWAIPLGSSNDDHSTHICPRAWVLSA